MVLVSRPNTAGELGQLRNVRLEAARPAHRSLPGNGDVDATAVGKRRWRNMSNAREDLDLGLVVMRPWRRRRTAGFGDQFRDEFTGIVALGREPKENQPSKEDSYRHVPPPDVAA
jgi:hypothetical protein